MSTKTGVYWLPVLWYILRVVQSAASKINRGVECGPHFMPPAKYTTTPARFIHDPSAGCACCTHLGTVYIFPDIAQPAASCETLTALSVCDIDMIDSRHRLTT